MKAAGSELLDKIGVRDESIRLTLVADVLLILLSPPLWLPILNLGTSDGS